MAIIVAVIWVPLKRSKLGARDLRHGIGRERGLPLRRGGGGRTKAAAYAVCGPLQRLWRGLSLLALTGIG